MQILYKNMSIILALIYPLAVQYTRGGLWYLVLPLTLFALLIDVAANYTELALLTWDFPKKNEYTFSIRLQRLQHNTDWRGTLCRPIVKYLNFFMPGHIPA